MGMALDIACKSGSLRRIHVKINMSYKDAPNSNSIINLYRFEMDVPFALQQFDSLLAIRLDEQTFTTHLVVSEDSIYQWNAELKTARYIVQSIYRSNVSL